MNNKFNFLFVTLFGIGKISKYRKKIIKNISNFCEISENKINIKGKTTEKLGLIGKEKAIACEVITSVIKYD